MRTLLKNYLFILAQLLIGLAIVIFTEQLAHPAWLPASVILSLFFLAYNLVNVRFFKLKNELYTFWNLRKLHFLLIGTIAGLLLASFPTLLAIITGKLAPSEIQCNKTISFVSMMLTFFIVSWEELWFRGLFLNYCRRSLSEVHIALIMGFLFMLMHVLNPEIDLLAKGPSLFFAGALLTLLYFYYRTIWLPLGLHFGNNLTGTLITAVPDSDPAFGSEGYLQAIILASVFFVLFLKHRNRSLR